MKADREADFEHAIKPRVGETHLGAAGYDQLAGRHRLLALISIIGGVIGLYGWLMFVMAFDHNGPFGQRYIAPGIDYMVYWRAARAAMAGDFALLADPVAFTAQISQQFHAWLSRPLPLFPWMYPPHYLLILMPFAVLPFAISYALFQVASFALAVAAGCRFWAGPARRWGLWAVGLALSPAASMNVIAGQNAFLTLALLLGGMGLLGRRDFVAGLILGLLSYKPQFAIMVAVALLAARHWRALTGAIVSASVAILLSAATFGLDPWREWLGHTLPGALMGGAGDLAWSNAGRVWGLSVWACVTALAAPDWLANAAQGAAIVLAIICTWIVFSGAFERDRRIAVLLTATLIAAPHVSPYDLVLLAGVVLLLYRDMLDGLVMMPGSSLLLLPWSAPLVEVPRLSVFGFAVPVVMVCLLFVLLRSPRPQQKLAIEVFS
ncbi:glycosyltransferase family 87 protein [Bradyrhizobium sp. PMVTL-01]|uniref:glycosyltransferase family 87 protein n=1 Tax=Bradyrhizobium sp. PMVTL-01 TaxID=3434999 RepID=UPI003F6EB71A